MNSTIIVIIAIALPLMVGFAAFAVVFALKSRRPQEDNNAVLLQQQVEALRKQVQDSLSQTSIQLQQQMNAVLQGMQTTTGQINQRLDNASKVVQGVQNQLGSLSQATEKIFEATKNISTLEDILKPPKLRGIMGEMMLENVLREILPSEDFFSIQHKFKNGQIVDAVIRLKDGLIPIDAKFPLENFRRMIECKEDAEKLRLKKEFCRDIKKHVDDISSKYILPDEGTFNFALMYIPAENVYYETIIKTDDSSEDIFAYATKKYVFPVSPNSLYPYLMTLSLGLRGLKIEKQAKEILGELSRVHGDLERFTADFKLVGDHIANAEKKYLEAEKRLDRVDSKLAALKEGADLPPGQSQMKVLE